MRSRGRGSEGQRPGFVRYETTLSNRLKGWTWREHCRVQRREVLFEGLTEDEILNLPKPTVEQLILIGEPLVFRVGSAVLLGSFQTQANRLVIELAQIEGGGEGVLMSLGSLARRYAILHELSAIEWVVHAVSRAKPNLKLRRLLGHLSVGALSSRSKALARPITTSTCATRVANPGGRRNLF